MGTSQATRRAPKPALMQVRGLNKRYTQRSPFSQKKFVVDALQDVDLEIQPQCLNSVVGESGSGKSTLAACLAFLETPDSGQIWFEGNEISSGEANVAPLRRKIQLVFQDSAGALNPRFTVAQTIGEPLEIQKLAAGKALRQRECELMEKVGLPLILADRFPLQLSGGQRQRLAIARALALNPSLLILDESLSGLDLLTQAQILRLLLELQASHALTYLLISHDLSLVGQVADYVAVMQRGRVVERGTREQVLANPQHDHTRELVGTAKAVESGFCGPMESQT